jgi:pimeloyl-ACP methyl ester carboxylesterase
MENGNNAGNEMSSTPMPLKLYVFSGLGADERAFRFIDFSGFDVTFIKWIAPEREESLDHYARRLARQIETPFPVFLGLSFGGIVAAEVARFIEPRKIILLSSVQTYLEVPFYYRWIGSLRLHECLPSALLKKPNSVTNWFFGAENGEDKNLLAEIVRDTEASFLNWALDKIVHWKNTRRHENVTHIHGTRDRIFPVEYTNANVRIEGGGHFMVANRAEEISAILQQEAVVLQSVL